MSKVTVVTDTTHYLPAEIVSGLNVHEVSLYVNWDSKTDRESDFTDFTEFYNYMRSAQSLPTTSQPSVGDFLGVYQPILERGDDLFAVHVSSGISGSFETAERAREQLIDEGVDGSRITVTDSRTTCAGLGLIVMAAAAAAREGASLTEVSEVAEAMRPEAKLWFAIDTLEFLRRGGRIGAAQAWLGSALKIKPILTLETQITPVERVRTSKRAFERLLDYLKARQADGCDSWLVQHIQAREQAEQLAARGREIFGTDPLFISEIGPVVGTHVGPGLLGISAVPSRLLRGEIATVSSGASAAD